MFVLIAYMNIARPCNVLHFFDRVFYNYIIKYSEVFFILSCNDLHIIIEQKKLIAKNL